MRVARGSRIGSVATIVAANILRPKGIPVLPAIRGIQYVLAFGSKLGSQRVLGHITEVTPELVMGKSLGDAPGRPVATRSRNDRSFRRTHHARGQRLNISTVRSRKAAGREP